MKIFKVEIWENEFSGEAFIIVAENLLQAKQLYEQYRRDNFDWSDVTPQKRDNLIYNEIKKAQVEERELVPSMMFNITLGE